MRKAPLCLAIALTAELLVSPVRAQQERVIPDGVPVLAEAGLRQRIIGSTIKGTFEGDPWTEFYEPGGRIRGSWEQEPYVGSWTIEGPWMCFDYGGEEDDECNTIELDGFTVIYYGEDGEPLPADRNRSTLNPGESNAPPPLTLGPINTGFWGNLAISGYDPVSYFRLGASQLGSPNFSYQWMGATWHFIDALHRDLFAADPLSYVPQYGGYGAYGMSYGGLEPIDPDMWRIVNGKLYLFNAEDVRDEWNESLIAAADAFWPQIRAEMLN